MKVINLKYWFFILTISSCTTTNKYFDKKEYRNAKVIATYSGMANELEDGYLVLKENGYFIFYQKIWLIVNIKQGESAGRYSQDNDTLYLDWQGTDPKQIKYYLSKKCVIEPITNRLWFIDETNNQRLWGMALTIDHKKTK